MIALKVLKEKIVWRETAPSILLVLNSFVWFTLIHAVFEMFLNEINLLETQKLILFTTYYVGIAVSAIFGSKIFPMARLKFLYLWLFIGTITTSFLVTVPINDMMTNVLFAFFLGISIGIGMPSCLSYFADLTCVENRGFVGGIIWSGVGFIVLLLALVATMLKPLETVAILTFWRLFGGLSFLLLTKQHKMLNSRKSPKYLELVCKRDVLLYLFPWIMFSIINFAESPILERVFGSEFFAFIELAVYIFIGIFAIVGGFIADIVGRKRVVITGFVMLGIEYAALSIFYDSPATSYLFLVFDGVTWGLFASVFFMAVWGDLGEDFEKEKYYALGGLPFLLASFVSVLIEPFVSDISPTAAFSFASFFLFLAVVPLMYAPETLPERKIRERELKNYIEKAKKIKEKYV
ncbi:MAG: MFS transporter [Candidatus Bathyarchaeia archaeon]